MAEDIQKKPKTDKDADTERMRILEFFGLGKTGKQVKTQKEKTEEAKKKR